MTENNYDTIAQCFLGFHKELLEEMVLHGTVIQVKARDYLIRHGQYVKSLPIVMEGVIKVMSEDEGLPFLLYYIHPGATCVISFAHLFGDTKVNFSGIAEVDSTVLLVPVAKAREWLLKYPSFSEIILHEYQRRYNDLLETTKQVICHGLEDRLLDYIRRKAKIVDSEFIQVSHQDIAADLGTSREVISRLLRKLEKDRLISQTGRKIKLRAGGSTGGP
ncbi:CRP/FNR family transcriptional regulator, anaerobic regulatory protein [Mucilaginibacter pineti]|uniref:CRP/FNR family transcriptional regulator, anaerobic regulatory protein n=1 Tax=Mucilaginibacter pineti TaxID=1391627 RepID=A0A1G7NRQ3_9SPHI|nr:Crp/Fnr family transcriptional regulator [Mucilaginibacter pineti]SDF76643.1 CRP/FNR family transcriptional regulator, anaerobic regulatory protein [Mucilaginibacter pineti]